MTRRQFLTRTTALLGVTSAGLSNTPGAAAAGRRLFLAGFSHETNTFHPVPTRSYSYSQGGGLRLGDWKDAGWMVVPGVSAHPSGGGTITEPACREAMAKVLGSLRAALPVDAVFLRLHGAMYAEGVGAAETELEDGVTRALEAKEPTVFLTDSGDNVTASTPGDLPIVLRHLVERKVKSAVVAGLNDAAATSNCFEAGEGRKLRLSIGASIDQRFGPPLEAELEVVRLVQNPRLAIARIGDVEVILADGPTAFTHLRQFEPCGMDPLSRKLVVVKEGYLYPGLTRIAPRHIMLLTPGAGDMRIERLNYARRRKPLFLFEPDTPFDPESAPS